MFNQIPSDWTSSSIGALGELYNGLSGKSANDFGVGKYYVTYMQVFRGGSINKTESGLVTVEENEIQNLIGFGDILFTTSSETPDEVGTANVFLNHSFEPFLNSFCFGLRIREHSILHPHFAKFLFRGNNYRRKVSCISQGSTRYNLSKKYFKKLKVILPPPQQQRKIASILTSIDEVIEVTEQKIKKINDLKTATMNELLTKGIGHSKYKDSEIGRIPESWNIEQLGSSLQQLPKSGIPSGMSKLDGIYDFFVCSKLVLKSDHCTRRSPSVLFSTGGEAAVHFAKSNYAYSTDVWATNFTDPLCNEFVYWTLQSKIEYLNYAGFQGSGLRHLDKNFLRRMKIATPPLNEQKKIAEILGSMETQIITIQQRIDKLEVLKKGLMEDLLTGKVRVKVEE